MSVARQLWAGCYRIREYPRSHLKWPQGDASQEVAERKGLPSRVFKDKSEGAEKRMGKACQAEGAVYLEARREQTWLLAVASTQGENEVAE